MPADKPRTTRLDPRVRRELILQAAARVYEQHDPAEVTFEEIAEAANVSRALVYNYFGDRGGLLAAVYLNTMDELIVELNVRIGPTLPPEERIRRIVHGYVVFADEHPAAWRLLQVTAAMSHPALLSARRSYMEQLAAWWGGKATARIVAFGVVGMLEAATSDWLRERDADLNVLSDVLFDLLWRGVGSLGPHGIALPEHRDASSVPT